MSIAIRAEGMSKKYVIGHQRERHDTLRDLLARAASSMRHGLSGALRPAPAAEPAMAQATREEFWALNDLSFEIEQGERIGVIGNNGAGKSTMLKILSRITEPTHGKVEINGRSASLLEVGTGFHPELSGRENIYLNGAILGMRREEIKRKFDEIVAFAEVEKFLDTPVKRYSSGMYVRLAFSVGAHLEPDILIVDEVLAVGDANFQKKCLGLMKRERHDGRTVLFVSHNMNAIKAICNRCLVLEHGKLLRFADTDDAIQAYLTDGTSGTGFSRVPGSSGRPCFTRGEIEVENPDLQPVVRLKLVIHSQTEMRINVDLRLYDGAGAPIGFGSLAALQSEQWVYLKPGENPLCIEFSAAILADGRYLLSLDISLPQVQYLDRLEHCLSFEFMRKTRVGGQRFAQSWGLGSMEFPLQLIQDEA